MNNKVQSKEINFTDEQVELIKNKQLDFYKQDQETILSFITDLLKKNQLYNVFLESNQLMDQFLFVQSSCQKQNSNEWGRLFSFFINMKPESIVQSQSEVKEKLDQIMKITQQLNIATPNGLDQEVQQKLQIHLESAQGKQLRLFDITREYVQKAIDIAYYSAFQLRKLLELKPDANITQYKSVIEASFLQMQIINKIPFN
ncbi:Conserved_hypothetical protein [Hexamita inflata]|uniref:Uncharacterized protein n=1 Tax=Hexamita inflata TaxID=28002 RepID=A0AA86UUM0_9EUKA|nr:Conserved hypothetical protein [Hexamita inflata]CAI9965246.1 Conserved hypothetical protein [Hexamita inflata]